MSEPFIGQIKIVGFNFAHRGWAECDGQLLPISTYSALFSLLGTTYGGDGRTTFGLPDLQGRVAIHSGTGPGLTQRRWGDSGGVVASSVNLSQIPSHAHAAQVNVSGDEGQRSDPAMRRFAVSEAPDPAYAPGKGGAMAAGVVSVEEYGGGSPHNNMQPCLAMKFVIALTGLFPSRS